MEKIKEFISFYKKEVLFIISALILFLIVIIISFYSKKQLVVETEPLTLLTKEEEQDEIIEDNTIFVDIKGQVKNPGVYEMNINSRVIDAIEASGGLINTSYTRNINLSKKLFDEAVIIVNSIEEINSKETSDSEYICEDLNDVCICEKEIITENIEESEEIEEKENKLININEASIEELITLSGIGEEKAKTIISYREKTPFETIEDIKNVSGIGNSTYEKIKDFIVCK